MKARVTRLGVAPKSSVWPPQPRSRCCGWDRGRPTIAVAKNVAEVTHLGADGWLRVAWQMPGRAVGPKQWWLHRLADGVVSEGAAAGAFIMMDDCPRGARQMPWWTVGDKWWWSQRLAGGMVS